METLLAGKRFYCREWLFTRLGEVVNSPVDEKGKRGIILTSSAGSGKSAFLSELCFPTIPDGLRTKLKSSVAASYFISPSAPRTKKLTSFLKTIGAQLKGRFPEVGDLPTATSGDVRSTIATWQTTLAALPVPDRRSLLVVDGLEMSLEIFNFLSNLNLPNWISVIYSVAKGHKRSREMIKLLDKVLVKITLDDVRKEHVCKDSQQYILRRLESNPSLRNAVTRDNAEFLSQLHIKASGCFLYLEVVLDGISSGLVNLRQVRDIPGTLSGLWLWLVQQLFVKKDFDKVRWILELLAAAEVPLSTSTITEAGKLKKSSIKESEVEKRLRLVNPLLHKSPTGWLPIHSSFLSWCQDVKYSTSKYLCDATKGHMALSCFYAIQCHKTRKCGVEVNYKKLTEQLLNHVKHTKFTEAELTLLLITVGQEKEVVRFLDRLAGNSLHDSECRLTTLATRGEEAQILKLLELGVDANGTQKDPEPTLVPLVAAAKFGNRNMVKQLIDNGADPLRCEYPSRQNFFQAAAQHGHAEVIEFTRTTFAIDTLLKLLKAKDVEGRTALRLASWQGDHNIVKLIVNMSSSSGISLDDVDVEGRSPLFAATYTQTSEVVKTLLDNKCDPNVGDRESRTPLSIAALQNQADICRVLLSAGADVNLTDDDGLTALHVACYEGHDDVVDVLIEFKANVDRQDNSGLSALMASVITGSTAIVDKILSVKARTDILDGDCRTVLSLAAQQGHVELVEKFLGIGMDEAHSDNIGWTPLHLVAAENHPICCNLLLDSKTNPDQRDNDGRTPLIVAAMEGHVDIVKALLDAGADPDIQSYEGFSALRFAALDNHTEALKYLVESMADVDSVDTDGRSILYSCVLDQNESMAKTMLRQGADPEAQDIEGRRPIHVAAWQGMTSLVKLLIDHGADPNSVDAEGRTALQNASWQNHVEVVELLVQKGASVEQCCHQGATPLCVAAQEGHIETCEALIKLGADPHQPDNCGRTPMRVAEKAGHNSLVTILKSVVIPIEPIKAAGAFPSQGSVVSGKLSQTESSGFVSDQNQDLINSPLNRKRHLLNPKEKPDQSSLSEYNFTDEIKNLTLPKSLRRSTLRLNELDSTADFHKKSHRTAVNPIQEENKSSERSSNSLNSSHTQSNTSRISVNKSLLNASINLSSHSVGSTPSKSMDTKMRRSNSMKGRISQLSKRVSKISLSFKPDKSTNSDDLSEDVLSYKRCTDKARLNLAPSVNPTQLSTDKVPIAQKLPSYMIPTSQPDRPNEMEFECDQRTAARLHVDQMITQSLRRTRR